MLPIIPIVIAGAVGAAGALLLSPNSGQKNREILAEKLKLDEARDLIAENVENIRPKTEPASEDEPIEVEIEKVTEDEAPEGEAPEGEAKEAEDAAE